MFKEKLNFLFKCVCLYHSLNEWSSFHGDMFLHQHWLVWEGHKKDARMLKCIIHIMWSKMNVGK